MPFTEQTISTAGTFAEQAIPADDSENLYDAGMFDAGVGTEGPRFDVNLKFVEQPISAQ